MAYQLFEASLKMKKPPAKEEVKAVETEQNISSRSEALSKSTN